MGLGDTTLVYNGVTIKNALTKSFQQEAVFDDSQTDVLYHRFQISVVGYIHLHADVDSPAKITGPTGEQSPIATQHQDIRTRLMQNRGVFTYSIGNVQLLGASVGIDVNNGPRPLKLEIVHIGGRGLLRVAYTIEVCKIECPGGSENPAANNGGVVNNRWSMWEEFDQNWFALRTVRGKLRVDRVDLNPHAFRGWVVPPLQRGFKRERMAFNTHPNGLELEYEIMDRQVWAAAPAPATSWTASHVEGTNDGVASFGSVAIRVEGPPKCDKKDLLQIAAQICEWRLQIKNGGGVFLIEGVEIIDALHESSIEMRVRIRHMEPIQSYFGTIGNLMGRPVSSDEFNGEAYDQFASRSPTAADLTSPTGLFICYLQQPCSPEHSIQQVTDAPPDDEYGGDEGNGETEIIETTGPLGNYVPSWSEEHAQAIYTYYTLENHYVNDGLRVQLPVAKFSNGGEALQKTSATVRLGIGATQRLIVIDAERAGDWPKVPPAADFEDSTGVNRLLNHRFINRAPRLATDGRTMIYAIKAAYLYAMDRPPTAQEIAVNRMPYISEEAGAKPITSDVLSLSPN